jgi:hypothetical protein
VPETGVVCATQFHGHPGEPPAAAPPMGALEAGHSISMLRDAKCKYHGVQFMSVSRNGARATQSGNTVPVSCTPRRYDSYNLYLDDMTITSGINRQVARETEGKDDRRRNENGGGTTHLALPGLSSLPLRRANPYSL